MRRRPAAAAAYLLLVLTSCFAGLGGGAAWLWQRAENARDVAELALTRAERAQIEAEAERERAEQARHGETKARTELAQVSYLRQVDLAFREWRGNEVVRARELLEECPPSLRRWEWFYVHGLCQAEEKQLPDLGIRSIAGVAFSPDGRFLAVGGGARVSLWDWRTAAWSATILTSRATSARWPSVPMAGCSPRPAVPWTHGPKR